MTAISSSEYVKTALKCSRFLVASKITVDEYAENLLSSCALLSEFDGTTTQAVVVSVPEFARKRLDQEIATVLAPDYRFPELHFGGPGPSQEVREDMRRLYEKRIRAFAAALATTLGTA